MKSLFAPLSEVFRLPTFESPEREQAYWAAEDAEKFGQRKFFLVVAIITFVAISLFDMLTGSDPTGTLMTIRMVTTAILAVIYFRFRRECSAKQRDREIFAFAVTVGVSLTLMSLFAPAPAADFYPFFLSVTMVFGSALVVPRYSTLARLCILTNCIYWPTAPFSDISMPAVYTNMFVMTLTTLSVVVGAFTREILERSRAIYQDQLAEAREDAIQSRDSALQASQAKSHLLANVSHELRTPMNAILGFSEVMKTEIFGPITQPQYREYISDIHFAGTLLQANINDLLDVSRLEVNKMTWNDEWSCLSEIIEHTVNTCSSDAETARIKLSQHICNPDILIFCDTERTAQILINLVTNALKFSESGAEITISSRTERGDAVLSVTDHGCGIPADEVERILEPFRQVDTDSMTTKRGGMGLGLSIVQALVQKLDGHLQINSTLGLGTTVSVTIPAARISSDRRHLRGADTSTGEAIMRATG